MSSLSTPVHRCAWQSSGIGWRAWARLGAANGWRGVIINGAVRDADRLAAMDIAIIALGTVPARGSNSGAGECGSTVTFGEVAFVPGHFICLDRDGVIVLPRTPSTN